MRLIIALLVAGVLAAGQPPHAAPVLAPCPPAGDTLSLLQPGDAAYPEAPHASAFLREHGFLVRCITRSTAQGLAGLEKAVGFQTDQGTITFLFIPQGDDIKVSEKRTDHGYRYTFKRTGSQSRHYEVNSDGRVYYLRHADWLVEVWDADLAARLRRIFAG